MRLMVCSKATTVYVGNHKYDKILIVDKYPTKEILKKENTEKNVIAIGGGAVLDTAKIICKNSIVAIPTTYSGASQTSHAVYWDKKRKYNIKTKKPILLKRPDYLKTLEGDALIYTKIDCLCHIMESFISPKANKESKEIIKKARVEVRKGNWLEASLLAGDAIEITGTSFLHGLSYPLTAVYGMGHGKALALVLHEGMEYKKAKELL